ncbi:MFS transporter [Carboxydocella sp. ULO1]|uniref:MFS transporter n=1 Tax=Carboxydocella sp. ULO1 TaxID=1926599 RepID=UPI0009AE3B5B|nr:MFS transporter [Carboxydocella sp. ULO1]GAW29075.1 MFS transporter [Carboxydocella sp. ULO1]
MQQRTFQLAVLALNHFWIDFYMNFVPPLLYLLGKERGLTLGQQSTLMLVLSMFSATLQPLLGLWADSRGKGWHLAVTGAIISLAMTAVAWVPGLPFMLLAVSLAGMANALYHPLGSVVTTQVAAYNKGSVLSAYITAGSLGYAFTPVIAVPIALHYGLVSTAWLAIPGVITSLLLAISSVASVRINPQSTTSAASLLRQQWRQLPLMPLILLNLIVSLRSWIQMAFNSFAVQLMVEKGYRGEIAGLALTWFLFAGTIGTLMAGRWADRWGARRVFWFSMSAAVVFLGLTLVSNGWLLWLNLGLLGAALSASFPLTIVMAQELLPDFAGMASGMMQGLGFGLGSLGLFLTGHQAESSGLIPALTWLLAPALLALLLLFQFNRYSLQTKARQ